MLKQLNLFHTLTSYFLHFDFNIILQHKPDIPTVLSSSAFPVWNLVRVSYITDAKRPDLLILIDWRVSDKE
jgi:hypothetical protein